MVDGHLKIDSIRLRKMVEDLEQYLNYLKKANNDISGRMAEVKTMWEGPAKEVFFSQYESEYLKFTGLCDSLNKAIKYLSLAARRYEVSDEKVRSVVNAISELITNRTADSHPGTL